MKQPTASAQLAVKFLAVAVERGAALCADHWAPKLPERNAYGNKLDGSASADMFAQIFRICCHEEGHATVMRHLNPGEASPHIELELLAHLTDKGVALGTSGGKVRAGCMFPHPHERVMVSVGGLLGEFVGTGRALEMVLEAQSETPPPNPFERLTGDALAAVVMMPSTVEAFPGCETDVDEVKAAILSHMGMEESGLDTLEESKKAQFTADVARFMSDSCMSAMRAVLHDKDGIVHRAKERARRVVDVVIEQTALIAAANDRIIGAGLGHYTQEEVMAQAHKVEADEAGRTWKC